MRLPAVGCGLLFGLFVADPATGMLVNGDFETADLAGWHVVSSFVFEGSCQFDTDGDSIPSASACFSYFGEAALSQELELQAGDFVLSADVASTPGGFVGLAGGTFELLLDGVVVDAVALAPMTPEGVRGALSATLQDVAAGTHEVRILVAAEIPCNFDCGRHNPPGHYVDNVLLPEPSRALQGTAALLLVAGLARRGGHSPTEGARA